MKLRVDLSRRNDLEGLPNQLYVMGVDEKGVQQSLSALVPNEFESIGDFTLFLRDLADHLDDAEAMRVAPTRHGPIPLETVA